MGDTFTNPQVTTHYEADIAIIKFDDKKANALGHQPIDELLKAFKSVEDAGAVILIGRPECFSAGFDLKIMQNSAEQAQSLLRKGVELFLHMYLFPRPVIAACTGHAIAAGAILLLSSDIRIGSSGNYKIGLPEVNIGMALPVFATELARERISKRHYTRVTSLGENYNPKEACDVGFLDEIVDPSIVLETSIEKANNLTSIGKPQLARTRISARGPVVEIIRQNLDDDLKRFSVIKSETSSG